MSSSNSPCAACKFLRRKCTQGCVFAPYFPPDQPQKFANVHRVFGASNVAKLLNELSPAQREDAVNSLAYEAEARLRDPVYGCVGYISLLQHKLKQVQHDLYNAKKELSAYIGPAALSPFLPHAGHHHHHHAALLAGTHHHPQYHHLQGASPSSAPPFGVVPGIGIGMGLGLAAGAGAAASASPHHAQMLMREQQQQQIAEAQQMAVAVAAVREQEMLRSYEQQQQEFARFGAAYTDGRGFNQMVGGGATVAVAAGQASALALVSPQPIETPFPVQQQQQPQRYAEQQQAQAQHQRAGSDDGRRGINPSS